MVPVPEYPGSQQTHVNCQLAKWYLPLIIPEEANHLGVAHSGNLMKESKHADRNGSQIRFQKGQ